ncbi:hypothetical protein GQ55_9G618300 [Panicum hallii var. hallii]|uniref:Uncharacterized protein n=1 Tax=Panicum hallii var. hallii TaxID=1504633 RepID=A0A2T7CHU2_9POAL|nr:hypothetical protein GQ55_9G618300 [Panicum hallii var. hallii]
MHHLPILQRWSPRKTIPSSSDDLGTYPTTPELTPPMPLTRISEQGEREPSENSGLRAEGGLFLVFLKCRGVLS